MKNCVGSNQSSAPASVRPIPNLKCGDNNRKTASVWITLERQQREQQNRLDAQRREANSNQYYRGSRSQGLFSR